MTPAGAHAPGFAVSFLPTRVVPVMRGLPATTWPWTTGVSAVVADTEAPGGYSQTGRKRVQGVEATLVGSLTDRWDLSLGYLHQQAEVVEGPNLAADGTRNLTYTPADAFTGWSAYRFDSGLVLGGGIRYT